MESGRLTPILRAKNRSGYAYSIEGYGMGAGHLPWSFIGPSGLAKYI